MNGKMSHPRIHGAIHGAEVMGEKVEDLRPFLHIFLPGESFMAVVFLLMLVCTVIGIVVRHF